MPQLFDIPALTEGMPEARVMRGENYFGHGWVELVDYGPAGVLAHVMGERGIAYVVEMKAADGRGAVCGCPDFQDSKLTCKHIVATALKVNAVDDAALKEAAQRIPRLRDMLDMEGREDADDLALRARRDPALLKDLEG
ncbi:MAG TPA: SWIM zinc finger family protein [Caulobacter sp.]|nr:SWIM zinc finger family protein [Caulobacter sp.]